VPGKADYEARRATAQSEREPKHGKIWFLPSDPTAFWTALLFVATGASVGVLWKTDTTLHQTLESNNRAWIAPYKTKQISPLNVGEDIKVELLYKNVGQSPAMKATWKMGLRPVPRGYIAGQIGAVIPDNKSCKDLGSTQGTLTIYPGTDEPYVAAIIKGAQFTQAMLDRKETLFWTGCITYETYEKRRQAPFCYVLRSLPDGHWVWEACDPGEDAT